MISVILPTYEAPEAVECALAALQMQTLDKGYWELFIIDDSADDSVFDVVWPPPDCWPQFDQLWYIRASPPRVGRFTASRARNIGVANARGGLIVFIDQDIMLAPHVLEQYKRAYEHYGDGTVIVGLYHWLRRIDFGYTDVLAGRFDDIVEAGLGTKSEDFPALEMTGAAGIQGRDFREQDFGGFDNVVEDAALGSLSGNIGYPRSLLIEVGGFDEAIIRHGGEDADLGLTVRDKADFLLWDSIWGVHRWHWRDQIQNAEDVQHNIEYIDRKHGVGKYAETKKWMDAQDWRSWRHYQKDVGGVLMQVTGDQTIWVCREGHRLGLPSPEWIGRLGFGPSDMPLQITQSALLEYVEEGVCDE